MIGKDSPKKIYEATVDTLYVDLSFDGKYIYMYNGICANYNVLSNIKTIRCIEVLDTHGNEIAKMENDDIQSCYFGDDKNLFYGTKDGGIYAISKENIGNDSKAMLIEGK